jgi:hypothetical protein
VLSPLQQLPLKLSAALNNTNAVSTMLDTVINGVGYSINAALALAETALSQTLNFTCLLSSFKHEYLRKTHTLNIYSPSPLFKVTVESLQSHCIKPQFHWSSGPPICFPSWGTRVQSPGGYLCETGILLLALSRYIGDPDVIDHCGLVWCGLHPELSLGHRADNVIIPLDLTQLFCPSFTLSAGPPSSFTTDIVGCWGGSPVESLQSHCIHIQFHWSSGPPICFPSWGTRVQSIPRGVQMWNRDSPVSDVSLHNKQIFISLWEKTASALSVCTVQSQQKSDETQIFFR